MGVALDGEHAIPILFITFEGSGYVQIMNANTMASLGTVTAPGSSNLAGIVYDQDNDRMYCVDRGQNKLYVYDWDYSTSTLSAVSGSPFTISASNTYGIALDQTNNKLYVATRSTTIYVYDLNADGNPFTISPAGTISTTYTAISVAVDEGNQYLYYGAGFTSNYYLSQYDITTPGHTHYYIADNEGVMGLGVDQDNHNVYISTGYSGDSLRVFDSSLNLLSTMSAGVNMPTGLVIPRGQISYNPLDLSKDDGLAEDECVNASENITYQICYNNSLNGFDVHNVTINDTLPANVTFMEASDGGSYDAETHTVMWDIGTVAAGATESCVTLTVQVNASAWNTTLTNSATIDSDETPPTSQSVETTVCEAPPPTGESTDSGGWTKNEYTTAEDVYATGSGFNPIFANMNIYVFDDYAWTDGDNIAGYTIYASLMSVPVTGGNVGPVIIWEKKDTKIGEYDIFFDANKNGIYDAGIDAIDDPNHPGFTISGQEVPALTPFGLLALVGLLSVIAVLTIRKKRE